MACELVLKLVQYCLQVQTNIAANRCNVQKRARLHPRQYSSYCKRRFGPVFGACGYHATDFVNKPWMYQGHPETSELRTRTLAGDTSTVSSASLAGYLGLQSSFPSSSNYRFEVLLVPFDWIPPVHRVALRILHESGIFFSESRARARMHTFNTTRWKGGWIDGPYQHKMTLFRAVRWAEMALSSSHLCSMVLVEFHQN